MIGVPKKEKTFKDFLIYILQITFTWNKLKWEKLNSPILNNSVVNGDFHIHT